MRRAHDIGELLVWLRMSDVDPKRLVPELHMADGAKEQSGPENCVQAAMTVGGHV